MNKETSFENILMFLVLFHDSFIRTISRGPVWSDRPSSVNRCLSKGGSR